MVINDIHRHVVFEETVSFPHYTFNACIKSRLCIEGSTALFLHPQYKRLYACPSGHQYRVVDVANNHIRFECMTCGKVTYQGYDPYRKGNESIIKLCDKHDEIYPFIYLALSNNTMQMEMDYFESNYSGKFWGIKVHPNLCSKRISDIRYTSNYPIIIHCGMTEYDSPKDIIEYAQRYPGKVVLAHLARCDESVLKLIAGSDNIFIDTSPTYLPFQIAEKTTDRYFPSIITYVSNLNQLFANLIETIGYERILFGTDAPWGCDDDAVRLYEELNLPEKQKRCIFQTNFETFLNG